MPTTRDKPEGVETEMAKTTWPSASMDDGEVFPAPPIPRPRLLDSSDATGYYFASFSACPISVFDAFYIEHAEIYALNSEKKMCFHGSLVNIDCLEEIETINSSRNEHQYNT